MSWFDLRRLAFVGATALGVAGCTSDEWPPSEAPESDSTGDPGVDSTGSTGEGILGAHLEVFAPESPSIHYIGESIELSAEVRDFEDVPIAFDDVVWQASGVEKTLAFGREGETVLPPGVYDITATARMPNGDRLESNVGGVRVQTRWTGSYSGDVTMQLALMVMGTPVNQTCTGQLEILVGFDGEDIQVDDGTCTFNAVFATFEATYTIDGEFHNGAGTGTIDYDIGGLFNVSLNWTGAFVEDGFLGGFAGTVSFPFIGDADATGTMRADFITPWVDPP